MLAAIRVPSLCKRIKVHNVKSNATRTMLTSSLLDDGVHPKLDIVESWEVFSEPTDIVKQRNEAIDLFNKCEIKAATAILDSLLEKDKFNINTLIVHCRLTCALPGRLNQALNNIDKAIGYTPAGFSADVWATKACVQFVAKRYDPAIVSAKQALSRNPVLFEANKVMALALSGLQQFSPSLIYYDQALKQKFDAESQYWRGQSLFFLDLEKEAFAWLRDPRVEEHPLRGKFYAGLREYVNGAYAKALENFSIAKTGKSWNPLDKSDVLSWHGECYLSLNDPEKALLFFDQALTVNKEDALSYFGKGQALKRLDKADEAQQAFNKALSIDPRFYKSDYLRIKKLQ